MKKCFVLLGLLASITGKADCNKGQDSWIQQVTLEETTDVTSESAVSAVVKAARHYCTDDSIQDLMPFHEIHCQALMPKNIYSNVCYMESKVGYFFVTNDMMGHFFVQYNRWD